MQQTQLFEPPPPEPPDEEGPIEWIVEALLPGAREIIENDPDTNQFSPEHRKRLAVVIAEAMAETAEQELLMIAMINECPPFDEPREPW